MVETLMPKRKIRNDKIEAACRNLPSPSATEDWLAEPKPADSAYYQPAYALHATARQPRKLSGLVAGGGIGQALPSTSHSKSTAYGIADVLNLRRLRFMSRITPSGFF
jgi:hypothetical protein